MYTIEDLMNDALNNDDGIVLSDNQARTMRAELALLRRKAAALDWLNSSPKHCQWAWLSRDESVDLLFAIEKAKEVSGE